MVARLNPFNVAPEAMGALMALENYLGSCGIDHSLLMLVKIRASQMNACSYCLHMHTRDARATGETEQRLYLLSAWRESPLFSPRERAALAWTEALTLISDTHAPDPDFDGLRPHFSEDEIVKLSLAIGTINTWNRVISGFRSVHPIEVEARSPETTDRK